MKVQNNNGCQKQFEKAGKEIADGYNLSSASSVQKSAQTLMEKQLLTHNQGVYEVYDKFMAVWLRES